MKPALRLLIAGEASSEAAQHVPISGAAGAAIYAALKGLAMHAGESTVTIKKERVAQGGYVYLVATNRSPALPAS